MRSSGLISLDGGTSPHPPVRLISHRRCRLASLEQLDHSFTDSFIQKMHLFSHVWNLDVCSYYWASLVVLTIKNLPAIQETPDSMPGLRRSPAEGAGYPLKYPCRDNSTCAHSVLMACSVVSDSATRCVIARKALLSMGFPRQEYWSRLPFPSPGIFPTQGSNLHLLWFLHFQACALLLSHVRSPCYYGTL